VNFRSFKLKGNAGQFEIRGWVRGVDADLSMKARDLDLAMLLGPMVRAPIAGRASFEARVSAGEERLRLAVDATAPSLTYGAAGMESLVTHVQLVREGARVIVEDLQFRSSVGRLEATATAELPDPPPSPDQPWWVPLRALAPWRGSLGVESLDLSVVSQLLPGERELAGTLTASVDLAGEGKERTGRTRGRIRDFGFNGYRFDAVEWQAHYADERLTLDPVSAGVGEEALRLTGVLPLRPVWGESVKSWFPEEPVDIRVELPEGTLARLPLFLPQLAAAEGKLVADIRVRGTPRKPELRGSLDIREAGIRVTGREEIYRQVRASVALEGDRIVIRDIEARQGSDGALRGNGEYQLFGEDAGRYRLVMRADNALAQASGEYAVSFDGDFIITDGPRVPGVVIAIPHIQGRVEVRTGVILYDFADPENVVYLTGPRQTPMYIYEIEVDAPRRVYWRTPGANIELEADLTMSQSLEGLKMWGTVKSLRGTYFFLENRFTVENGELIFDEAESLNPKITAGAVTRVTRALGQNQYDKEEIHIELTGRIQSPEMHLWSSSGLAQTDIVSLLTVGRFGIGDEEYSGADQRILVGVTGTQYLVRQLAREFPEISSLLGDIEVGTTVGEGERIYTTVGVSRYFTPDLLLRYSQVVGGSGGSSVGELNLWDLSAEYRLGRLFYLTGERIERRVTSSLGTGTPEHEVEYNLDVRARLEY
jgi:autotransporter translocation and assembly factor TamB